MQTQYFKVSFSYQHCVDNIKKLGPSAEIVRDELEYLPHHITCLLHLPLRFVHIDTAEWQNTEYRYLCSVVTYGFGSCFYSVAVKLPNSFSVSSFVFKL
jgi:hypothetical protein